jgi:hypothetical protein
VSRADALVQRDNIQLMPYSQYIHLPTLFQFLRLTMPSSVLDVGVGSGKMGFVARDVLDIFMGGKYKKEDWTCRIDGIEAFPDYIQPHHHEIYNNIYLGDAYHALDTVGSYDLIILGDVLEHFEKEKAWRFLDKCAQHCNEFLIINIPLGEWDQAALFGNCYEEHLSTGDISEFEPFITDKRVFSGAYACLLIKKERYISFRRGEEREPAAPCELTADIQQELAYITVLINENRIQEAMERVKKIAEVAPFPQSVEMRLLIEQLEELGKKLYLL